MRIAFFLFCVAPAISPAFAARIGGATQIRVDTTRPIRTIDAASAFGATVDAHPQGETAQSFTPENIDAMLSIGFQPVSYRLVTELGGEAWHWNPRGSWSDPQREEGYWTSSSELGDPIALSYGYRLPRRGNTIDQAQNNDYSRIDDGDRSTFWKSNPYLEDHPQWIVADIGHARRVDKILIAWGDPYATDYRVQWWDGIDPINDPSEGDWIDFANGAIAGARGGDATLRIGSHRARFIRILMTRSSHTGPSSGDVRDRIGFSVRELDLDGLRHGRSRTSQSVIWVSSTDPWHRRSDIDLDTEQLGIDALFASGITRGRGVLMAVPLLYGTPEDTRAQIEYLKRRAYPISWIEMGEEPDGQNVSPEDYGSLYRQWARVIHEIDPSLRLGGPGFQSTIDFVASWPDQSGSTAWLTRFLADLRQHDQSGDFSFFSFEWYPFDDLCASPQRQIERAPALLRSVLARWRREGLSETIPWIATEYGYSSYAGQPEVDLSGALFDADFVAQFLILGGTAAYFYSYEPDVLIRELACPTWGNLTPFLSDAQHHVRYELASYWTMRMVTREWSAQSGAERLYATAVIDRRIGAYAIERPDGTWSVLLINRDTRAKVASLGLFSGEVRMTQYSPAQYQWHADGEDGHPTRDLPPVTSIERGDRFALPPHSVTVITGNR